VAVGIFNLYFFRYLAIQFCSGITPEGEPLIPFRLGILIFLQDRDGGF